jgi:hypothetical protein
MEDGVALEDQMRGGEALLKRALFKTTPALARDRRITK